MSSHLSTIDYTKADKLIETYTTRLTHDSPKSILEYQAHGFIVLDEIVSQPTIAALTSLVTDGRISIIRSIAKMSKQDYRLFNDIYNTTRFSNDFIEDLQQDIIAL